MIWIDFLYNIWQFSGVLFLKNPDFCDFGLPGTSKVLKSDRFYKVSASGAEKVICVKFHEVFTFSQNFVQKSSNVTGFIRGRREGQKCEFS